MSRQGRTGNAMPGYGGHIPCMKNHVIGRSYGEATARSKSCEQALRSGLYDIALPISVDSRPQGRDFLYAQTARAAVNEVSQPTVLVPRVSKRMPPLGVSHGSTDIRQMKTVVGTTELDSTAKQYKTTSLPDLPYKNRRQQMRKYREPMEQDLASPKSIPGYTGHQGYIPAKNNHIYGKSAGKASDLAALAEKTLLKGQNAGTLPDLIDNPPQGRVDLYAQSQEKYHMEEPKPLEIKVDKARVDNNFLERRNDYRMKERYQDDAVAVMQAKHHTNGYTGHIHASQHIYGTSYGKMTRNLCDKPANPATSQQYIDFTDDRALVDQTGELKII